MWMTKFCQVYLAIDEMNDECHNFGVEQWAGRYEITVMK